MQYVITLFLLFVGNGWVSWRSDNISTEYLGLLFEFDQVRNFSAVYLHTNNFFSRNVQVNILICDLQIRRMSHKP